jgi:predicted aconitase
MFADTEGDMVASVVEVVVQTAEVVQAENIVGMYNNTIDGSVVYNSIAFHILDN